MSDGQHACENCGHRWPSSKAALLCCDEAYTHAD